MELSIEEMNIPENNFRPSIPTHVPSANKFKMPNKKIYNPIRQNNPIKPQKPTSTPTPPSMNSYDEVLNIFPQNKQQSTVKMVKQPTEPTNKIDYDEILKKMGMYRSGEKLYWETPQANEYNYEDNYTPPSKSNVKSQSTNSYIHNKYFKNELKEENPLPQQVTNPIEYRNMLIQKIIHNRRIQMIKSKKMSFIN